MAATLVGEIKSILADREVGWVTVDGEDFWFHRHLVGPVDAMGRRVRCRDGLLWEDLRKGLRVKVQEVDPSPHGRRCRVLGRAE
jgi:hypothetical protein